MCSDQVHVASTVVFAFPKGKEDVTNKMKNSYRIKVSNNK